jgi:hypothetical protein
MILTRIGRVVPAFQGRWKVDWPTLLDRHGVEFALLNRQGDSDLVMRLRSHPGWVVDDEEGETLLFRRRPCRLPSCA